MPVQALFGLSVAMSFIAWGIAAWLFLWPWLRSKPRDDALLPLVVLHTFRFVGLSFLVPGVVSPSLSPGLRRARRLWRPRRGNSRDRRDFEPPLSGNLGHTARLDLQSLGHGGSAQRVLSGPVWRRHRTRLAWRGVFHPDGHRAAAARYPPADLPAPAAAARLKLTPRSRRRCRPKGVRMPSSWNRREFRPNPDRASA